jgi:TRAP-type C4-dicarboxylate transport system substrate-binding protein
MKILGKILLSLITLSFITTSSFAVTWKASHQWPGGKGDPRDEMVQIIKREVEKANVDFKIQIYPAQSLYKAKDQWKPMTDGILDMSAFPLDYANKFHPEFGITLMPGVVKNHDHATRINKSEFMKSIRGIMDKAGVVVIADAWLGGAFASKTQCILSPADAKGQTLRAAGPMFDTMLKAAGASISSMASSEIYTGLQTGVLTGANTSSGSFVSYKLYEHTKCLTPPGKYGLWFMYEPILASKKSYDKLNAKQKAALKAAGEKAEKYMSGQVALLDKKMEDRFKQAGVKLVYMNEKNYNDWLAVAKKSSYVDFAKKVPTGKKLLDQALAVK